MTTKLKETLRNIAPKTITENELEQGARHLIGFAKCFGITIMENFERPYFSCSIKEFWRRWHISLSSWLRDYVYIPLGGNRKGLTRTLLNIMIVFLISGIWHGAAWTFIAWGLIHGLASVIHRLIAPGWKRIPKVLTWFMTFLFFFFSWIFFRSFFFFLV